MRRSLSVWADILAAAAACLGASATLANAGPAGMLAQLHPEIAPVLTGTGPDSARTAPDTAGQSATAMRRAQYLRLQTRFEALNKRVDSLWSAYRRPGRARKGESRRLLNELRAVRDGTRVQVDALGTGEINASGDVWEGLRAQAEMAVDSLQRSFDRARTARGPGR